MAFDSRNSSNVESSYTRERLVERSVSDCGQTLEQRFVGGKCTDNSWSSSVDVSKFLKFASGDALPDWSRLFDRDIVLAYFDKLERCRCGPDGRVVKMDAIESALRFTRVKIPQDDPQSPDHIKAQRMSETLLAWKTAARKQKAGKRIEKLENLSSEIPTLSDVNSILKNEKTWEDFTRTIEQLEAKMPVSDAELNRCTVKIAMLLTIRSWLRPGAVMNMTLEDYTGIID